MVIIIIINMFNLRNTAKNTVRRAVTPYSQHINMLAATQVQQRHYFSLMDKIRDKVQQPLRHLRSFADPDG